MSSCRKPEMHNDLPKITKINLFNKQWSKFLKYVYFIIF